MGDGYFYTLSAIAQSFAAIIALNGIFVIYKMQLLSNRSNELLTQLRMLRYKEMGGNSGFITDRERAKKWIESVTNQELFQWARTYVGDGEIVTQNATIMDEYNRNNKTTNIIIGLFKPPLILDGIVIAGCFVLLPLKIILPCLLQYIALGAVVLFSLTVLYKTIRSVFKIMITNDHLTSPTKNGHNDK